LYCTKTKSREKEAGGGEERKLVHMEKKKKSQLLVLLSKWEVSICTQIIHAVTSSPRISCNNPAWQKKIVVHWQMNERNP